MSEPAMAARRVHPGTIVLRFLKEAPSTILAAPAALAVFSGAGLKWALLAAAGLAALVLFANWLAWSRFRYGVGEREIAIESGILSRNRRVIPFDRVQDVDIERPLLHRMFGLAKVRIETGAGGKDEGLLDSVTVEEAARLREAVRAWRAGAPAAAAEAQAAPEADAEPQGRTVFAMDLRRVFLSGLFNFSLAFMAGIFAFLQMFDDVLPFDIYDPARWIGVVDAYLPDRFSGAAIAAVLVLAALVGVVAGVLRTVSQDYGYTLAVEGGRFRRERGLLTRSEAVIARSRVQLGQVETGPVRRWLGWFTLSFQTLGAGTGTSGLQSAAPFARRDEVAEVLAETNRLVMPPAELEPVSRRHVVRGLARLVPVAAAVGVAGWFVPALWLGFAVLPVLGLLAALERRFHRYAMMDGLLFVERGVWRQRLWIVPLERVQALSLSRSWLQRRLGLASLAIDTAGAPALGGARIVDVRLDDGQRLAEEISAGRRPFAQSSGRKSGTER